MSDLKIITNNHQRPVIDAWELTPAERAEFDYLDWPSIDAGNDSASFVRYRGELYDLGEFMYTGELTADSPLRQWDGYQSDSFFSGLVVRYSPDTGYVAIGTYIA